MPLTVNHLLLVFGVALIILGTLSGVDQRLTLPTGIVLLVLAFVSDWRRAKRAKIQRSEEVESHIAELTHAPWGSDQTMSIKGSLWINMILLLTVLVSAVACGRGLSSTPITWPMTLCGGFFLAIALIPALRGVPNTFKPVLELSTSGLVSPIHRAIAWSDISGIHLDKTTHKGITTFWLRLQIVKTPVTMADIHWSEKLFGLFRDGKTGTRAISIRLFENKDKPEVVYAVARHLWKQATGNDHNWFPKMSNSFNNAEKRNKEILAKMQDPVFMEQAFEHKDEVLQNLDQLKTNLKLMNDEARRSNFKVLALAALLLIPMLLILAGKLSKLF